MSHPIIKNLMTFWRNAHLLFMSLILRGNTSARNSYGRRCPACNTCGINHRKPLQQETLLSSAGAASLKIIRNYTTSSQCLKRDDTSWCVCTVVGLHQCKHRCTRLITLLIGQARPLNQVLRQSSRSPLWFLMRHLRLGSRRWELSPTLICFCSKSLLESQPFKMFHWNNLPSKVGWFLVWLWLCVLVFEGGKLVV